SACPTNPDPTQTRSRPSAAHAPRRPNGCCGTGSSPAPAPGQPFWWFADKHHADPDRYPLPRARADYTAQPRILAMTACNALPHRTCELPTASLEAFQAGYRTYLNLAWLAAVPGDGIATAADAT